MDISTLLGLVMGFIVIALGLVSSGDMSVYLGKDSIMSFIIVVGGAIASVFVGFPKAKSMKILQIIMSTIQQPKLDYVDAIRTLVSFSEKARREGLLSLEGDISELKDTFMQKGIQLIVDGTDPDLLKSMMEIEIDLLDSDLSMNGKMLESAGAFAPAFGMLGTVMGLIAMLQALNNPDALGPAMAVALITTFYGSLLSNLIFLPMGEKLGMRKDIFVMHRQMILEGVLSIQAGDNPRLLEEKLKTFLPPDARKAYDAAIPSKE